jgi:hypothetical protein
MTPFWEWWEIGDPRAPCALSMSAKGFHLWLTYLWQVNLNLILSICSLSNAIGESQVHSAELIPHLIGSHNQEVFNVLSELRGGGPFTLGAQNIVICKFGPWLRHWDPENRKKNPRVVTNQPRWSTGNHSSCNHPSWSCCIQCKHQSKVYFQFLSIVPYLSVDQLSINPKRKRILLPVWGERGITGGYGCRLITNVLHYP